MSVNVLTSIPVLEILQFDDTSLNLCVCIKTRLSFMCVVWFLRWHLRSVDIQAGPVYPAAAWEV